MIKKRKRRIQKYVRREFRPGYVFDIPIYVYWFFLALKSGHFLFFSNINPGMIFSGFAGYGKYTDIIRFDLELRPQTILVKVGDHLEQIKQEIEKNQITYPFVMKPDMGRTARDIVKIFNEEQLQKHLASMHEDYVIQEFIDYPLEYGILYYRMPNEENGHITGITDKRLLSVVGDGKHTL